MLLPASAARFAIGSSSLLTFLPYLEPLFLPPLLSATTFVGPMQTPDSACFSSSPHCHCQCCGCHDSLLLPLIQHSLNPVYLLASDSRPIVILSLPPRLPPPPHTHTSLTTLAGPVQLSALSHCIFPPLSQLPLLLLFLLPCKHCLQL